MQILKNNKIKFFLILFIFLLIRLIFVDIFKLNLLDDNGKDCLRILS